MENILEAKRTKVDDWTRMMIPACLTGSFGPQVYKFIGVV